MKINSLTTEGCCSSTLQFGSVNSVACSSKALPKSKQRAFCALSLEHKSNMLTAAEFAETYDFMAKVETYCGDQIYSWRESQWEIIFFSCSCSAEQHGHTSLQSAAHWASWWGSLQLQRFVASTASSFGVLKSSSEMPLLFPHRPRTFVVQYLVGRWKRYERSHLIWTPILVSTTANIPL